jgi:hypothetical protein
MASSTSFFFSHRIWFYFQSMLFNQSSNNTAITEQALKE